MEITVINADKALYRKSIEIAFKYTKMTKSKKDVKNASKNFYLARAVLTFSIATCRNIDMCFRRIKFRHKPLA